MMIGRYTRHNGWSVNLRRGLVAMLAPAALVFVPHLAIAQSVPTSTTLTQSSPASTFGQSVTLTATVDGGGTGTPTGTVNFQDGPLAIGAASLTAQGIGIASVSLGADHACALTNGGMVFCWGENANGQLGNGTFIPSSVPVAVTGLTGVTRISVGGDTSCALLATGSVLCWGAGTDGQIGDGALVDRGVPTAVSGVSDAVTVSTSGFHTCVARSNGTAQCWGYNDSGELGNGTVVDSAIPVAVSITGFVTALEVNYNNSCALLSTGNVQCWGYNYYGQLGNGTTAASSVPVTVANLSGVVSVSLGANYACAKTSAGAHLCWGEGNEGKLGTGADIDQTIPTPITVIPAAANVATGKGDTTCAVLADGTLRCWGEGFSGELGNGAVQNSLSAVTVSGISNAASVAVGERFACAVLSTGGLKCWGSGNDGRLGANAVDQFVNATAISGLTSVDATATPATGSNFSCVLQTTGGIQCWGSNSNGQLGNASEIDSIVPVSVLGITDATAVSAGGNFACAIVAGGAVKCWGSNSSGQLGNGTFATSFPPVAPNLVVGITGATAISAGDQHACAVLGTGQVQCWGAGSNGRLGNNSTASQATPVAVSGITNATSVEAGNGSHSCAILATGAVQCWGNGISGQLGNGASLTSNVPVAVSGITTARNLALGANHSCARLDNQQVQCWGSNTFSQLGGPSASNLPLTVAGISTATRIAAGDDHTCVRLSSGIAQCWGRGTHGRLGDGNQATSATPVTVAGLSGVGRIAAGDEFSCANQADGTVYCWGRNNAGQIGRFGTSVDVPNPIDVANINLLSLASASLAVPQLSVGDHSFTASYAGDATFSGSASAALAHAVAKAAQTISFTGPTGQTFAPGLSVGLSATATSGLPVAFSSSTPVICSVSGAIVTVLAAGTCTIDATQGGDGNFNAATTVPQSFAIAKAAQTISFTGPAAQVFAPGRRVTVAATTNSGLAVTFSSTTPAVCTVAGTSVILVGPGTCSITAAQAGNGNFNAAAAVARAFSITIGLGGQTRPHGVAVHNQGPAAIAILGTGAVVAYADRKTATGPFAITVQRLTATGAATGAAVQAAAPLAGVGGAHVAALTTGGFVVVWHGPDASGTGIFAQRFTATGAKTGGVIPVNSVTAGAQSFPKVAPLPGGQFVVTWQTHSTASLNDIAMRRFSATGTALGLQATVNTLTPRNQTRPSIAALGSGTYAIIWSSETAAARYGVRTRLFRSTGVALTPEKAVASPSQLLAPLPVIVTRTGLGVNSGFAMAYEVSETAAAAIPANIHVKTMSVTGVIGATIRVANSVTAGHQSAPALGATRLGGFAVAFQTPDGSSNGISMRLFNGGGVPMAHETRINTVLTGVQSAPSVAPLKVGTTTGATGIVVWTTPGTPVANGTDLAVRRFQAM
ncbi:MAG: hypothetical protein MUC58_11390 [Rhizobiaceae bacterium]|nr:hypothetical protein [Rhizobiaceae bacterium]